MLPSFVPVLPRCLADSCHLRSSLYLMRKTTVKTTERKSKKKEARETKKQKNSARATLVHFVRSLGRLLTVCLLLAPVVCLLFDILLLLCACACRMCIWHYVVCAYKDLRWLATLTDIK